MESDNERSVPNGTLTGTTTIVDEAAAIIGVWEGMPDVSAQPLISVTEILYQTRTSPTFWMMNVNDAELPGSTARSLGATIVDR